jgi:MarR family transcriptional regulator, organic hydroperoxide resistance regulator
MDYKELAAEFLQNMYLFHKDKQHKKTDEFLQGGAFILQYLYMRKDNVLPSEISNEMSISTARIAAALGNLESKGLINREIDKNDRRQILVSLTPEGIENAKKHQQEVEKDVMEMLQCLGEHDAREYVRIIGKLAENYKKKE